MGKMAPVTLLDRFRSALNCYHQQPPAGLLPIELAVIDGIAEEVLAVSDVDPAWHRAATAIRHVLRDHSENVVDEWIAAFSAVTGLPW
jgi:hypothetical protein